jgi:hypothetical protein
VKPVLQALLLADRVYQDAQTGKKIIAGTFHRMLFTKSVQKGREIEVDGVKRMVVPGGMHPGSPYAFVSLTEIRGKVSCVLRYVDLGGDKPLLQCGFEIDCKNPLETVEVVLPMPPLPPNPGIHALELLCDDEPIGSLRITVEERKEDEDVSR